MKIGIGKSYNVFDDGKISKSRLYQVKVTEIVPFNEIDDDTLEQWKNEVNDCDDGYIREFLDTHFITIEEMRDKRLNDLGL